MERTLHRAMPTATLAVVLICYAVACAAQTSAPLLSHEAASRVAPDRSLPKPFVAILPKIKAKSRIPVLLPSKLPRSIKDAVLETVSANNYAISLFYQLGIGDAGFAGYLSAQSKPGYNPRELPGVHEVRLAHGVRGFFRPVSCGGSCAPANLWWMERGVLYQIQISLSSSLTAQNQQKVMVAIADSAVLGGPR